MQILIAGDSFAADWTVKYPDQFGWPNLLANKHSVKNLAQAGVSEYKIYQQVMSVNDINYYDFFIICHTSPYRIVTRKHPVHYDDVLHHNADLILTDLDYHAHTLNGFFNRSLQAARLYVNHHYDIQYYQTTYNLFVDSIAQKLPKNKTILIGNNLNYKKISNSKYLIDCKKIQKTHPGLINHLSNEGNQMLFNLVDDKINKLL